MCARCATRTRVFGVPTACMTQATSRWQSIHLCLFAQKRTRVCDTCARRPTYKLTYRRPLLTRIVHTNMHTDFAYAHVLLQRYIRRQTDRQTCLCLVFRATASGAGTTVGDLATFMRMFMRMLMRMFMRMFKLICSRLWGCL